MVNSSVNSYTLLTLVQEAASETTSHQRLEELAQINVKLGRVVAANICTTPELLQELSYSDDGEIRKAITTNPNTPTDILLQMGAEFPEELLENPIFSLLLLENPNLLQEMPEETQVSLLKLANIPDAFVQWALTSRRANIMYAVAMNPKASKLDLQKLINEASKHWVTSRVPNVAKMHVNWTGEMTTGWDDFVLSILQKRQLFKDCICEEQFCETSLWQIGVIPDSFLPSLHRNSLAQIARHRDTPAHIIAAMLENPKTVVKKILIAVAGNMNTPVHILEQLAGDRDAWIRRTVFQNPSTPNAIFQLFHEYEAAIANPHTSTAKLSEMATQEWEQTLLGIASHGNTTPELLTKLATAKSWEIRAAVALNPNVSMQVLEEFILDKRLGVRSAVARNPKTPASLLVRLLQDKKTDLRREIAKHPQINSAILELLVRDADYYVRVGVVENVKTPVEVLAYLANDKDAYIRKHVARNPRATEATLLQLASDSDSSVRQYVARNPNIPISVLTKLASDEVIGVRYSVAENFSTPNHILTYLTTDKYVRVGLQAVKTLEQKQSLHLSSSHNNSTSQIIDNDYSIASNPKTPIQVLIELILKDSYDIPHLATPNLSQKLALNSDIPSTLLEKCAEISKLDIKIALLRHPNVPVSILHKFAASSSFRLRRLLSQNPNLDASLLEKLLQDKHPEVRSVALENILRTTKKWDNRALKEFLREWEAVQNSGTPAEKLMELSASKWVLIREAVALHPQTAMLLGDGITSISKKTGSLKKNYTPATLLEKLAKDKNPAVKTAVARNIHTPIKILEDLLRNKMLENSIHLAAMKNAIARYPERASLYFGQYFQSSQSLSRFFILLHPLAPTSLLKKHFRSSSWLERYAISKNPNTPSHIREYLTQDANKIVRATAREIFNTRY
ncbi:HEAT repeat domain-containing protein [Brunnivagina elsteri]|uniref:Leucine rich repeat variant n=1 Tax=Brunnivagina elsteri CCALA 953 TaxID=987040 RepID=A0A2A2TGF7_9CYAN|nr:HEAT repeat domain-containing protein [Calothrix elsteri]PAX52803.1 hypothetical protein CK510_17335 [Calothrix elsteri CCALA 953]